VLTWLLCRAGMHLWETDEKVVKEPLASDDGLLMVKVTEERTRFCVNCKLKGGTQSMERYEIFDDYHGYEEDE